MASCSFSASAISWAALGDGVGAPVASGSARCASRIGAIDRFAFDLLGDPVHHRSPPRSDSRPAALSAESITASAPSNTAVATSETSARVGTGAVIMLSSICVAIDHRLAHLDPRRCRVMTLLRAGHLLQRHFHAEIAARHHDRIGGVDDLLHAAATACGFSILAIEPAPDRARSCADPPCPRAAARRTARSSRRPPRRRPRRRSWSLSVMAETGIVGIGQADALARGQALPPTT